MTGPEDKYPTTRWGRNLAKQEVKKRLNTKDTELKNPEQIVRERLRLEFIKNKHKTNMIKKDQNRKKHSQKMKAKGK